MRIAIAPEVLPPKQDGVTIDLSRLVAHLSGRGHSLLLLGPSYSSPSLHGVRVLRAPSFPIGLYPGLHFSVLSPGLAVSLYQFRPDVLLVVDPFFLGAQALAFAALLLPGTRLVAAHCTNVPFYTEVFGHAGVAPGEWTYLRRAHSLCARTIVRSESSKGALCRMGGFDVARMRVWRAGVDSERFCPGRRCETWRRRCCNGDVRCEGGTATRKLEFVSDSPCRVLLYVGRVSWEKNIGALLDLAAALKKPGRRPPVRLVIVGDGPAVTEFFSLLDKQGSRDVVTYLGWLSGDELAAAYASSDVFVCPSVSETMGNVVVEAMAAGLPVVAFDSEGVRDSVLHNETGILVPGLDGLEGEAAANVEKWVRASVDLVHDHKRAKAMGLRARERVVGWTMEKSLESCERIFLEVSKPRPSVADMHHEARSDLPPSDSVQSRTRRQTVRVASRRGF